jgi:molybdenum cofactor synthesis domain-containing protein
VRAVVITVSTRASRGVYADLAGPRVAGMLTQDGFECDVRVVPDGHDVVAGALREAAAGADLVVTCGGTGLTPMDVTPEATRAVLDREIPGIAEAMRAASLAVTPMAMLSRGTAGVLGTAVVVNLPGSENAASENLEVVRPVLRHAFEQVHGGDHPRPGS